MSDDPFHFQSLRSTTEAGSERRVAQTCRQCEAEINYPRATQPIRCPYCGTHYRQDGDEVGPPLSDSSVKFSIQPEFAEEKVRRWLKASPWAPSELRNPALAREIRGVYVPIASVEIEVSSSWRAKSGVAKSREVTSQKVRDGGVVEKTHKERYIEWQDTEGELTKRNRTVVVPATWGVSAFSSFEGGARSLLGQAASQVDVSEAQMPEDGLVKGVAVDQSQIGAARITKTVKTLIETDEREACAAAVPGDTHQDLEVDCNIVELVTRRTYVPLFLLAVAGRHGTHHVIVNGCDGTLIADPKPLSRSKVGGAVLAGLTVLVVVVLLAMGPSPTNQDTASVNPTQRSPEVATAPATYCGSARAEIPPGISTEVWSNYTCQVRSSPKQWKQCIRRARYTQLKSQGCPGKKRCCPP
jgi:hypothetical protein